MRPEGASSVKETVEPKAARQASTAFPVSPSEPERAQAQTVRRMQQIEDRLKQLEFRFANLEEELMRNVQEE